MVGSVVITRTYCIVQPQDLSSSPVMTQLSHQGVQQALHRHGNSLAAKNSVALWQSHGPRDLVDRVSPEGAEAPWPI